MFKWYSFFYFQNTFKIITNLLSHSIVAFSDYLFHLFYNLLCCCFFFHSVNVNSFCTSQKKILSTVSNIFFYSFKEVFLLCSLYLWFHILWHFYQYFLFCVFVCLFTPFRSFCIVSEEREKNLPYLSIVKWWFLFF